MAGLVPAIPIRETRWVRQFYVYILASRPGGAPYVGVTNNLVRRVYEHRNKVVDGHTKRYGIDRLVWYEVRDNASGRAIGEYRFLGLYTTYAYRESPREIPLLRGKFARVLERAGFIGSTLALLKYVQSHPEQKQFIVATEVGGVPEIFGPQAAHLIPTDDIAALVEAMGSALNAPGEAHRVAEQVRARVRAEFSLSTMVEGGLAAYREALVLRKLAQFT